MTVTSLKSAFDALFSNDTDLSPMERFTSILMSISMFVPGVIGSFRSLSKAI
jgi:hypothetical protein